MILRTSKPLWWHMPKMPALSWENETAVSSSWGSRITSLRPTLANLARLFQNKLLKEARNVAHCAQREYAPSHLCKDRDWGPFLLMGWQWDPLSAQGCQEGRGRMAKGRQAVAYGHPALPQAPMKVRTPRGVSQMPAAVGWKYFQRGHWISKETVQQGFWVGALLVVWLKQAKRSRLSQVAYAGQCGESCPTSSHYEASLWKHITQKNDSQSEKGSKLEGSERGARSSLPWNCWVLCDNNKLLVIVHPGICIYTFSCIQLKLRKHPVKIFYIKNIIMKASD